jgi:hypothetical protein
MADPVSWLLIEPGWRVETSDGSEAGRVEEVTGDSSTDIFDGLAIAFSALGEQRYVPAEQVAAITPGTVRLRLGPEEARQLAPFQEPAEQIAVEPEQASRLDRLKTYELEPETHPHRTGLWRRLAEWFGRTGR